MTQSDRLSRDSTKSTSGPHTNEEELLLREGSSSSSQGGLPSIFVPQNLRTSALLLLNVDISTTLWLLLMMIVQIPLSWIRDIRRLTVTNLFANVLILFGLTSCLGLAMRQMMGVESVSGSW
jgi:hypothetical protein